MVNPSCQEHRRSMATHIAPRPPMYPNPMGARRSIAIPGSPVTHGQNNGQSSTPIRNRNAVSGAPSNCVTSPLHCVQHYSVPLSPSFSSTTPQSTGLEPPRFSSFSEIEDLRRSHLSLLRRVEQLAGDVITSQRATESALRSSARESKISHDAYILRRTISFAGLSASKTLLGPSKELSKTPTLVNEANSVRKTTLKSKAIDCTLLEFRVFALACSRNESISCALIPSEYYVLNLPARKTNQVQITFPTYYDFCVALDIDIGTRERGLYRQQRNRRNSLRAVQIVGIEQEHQETRTGCRPVPERRVFPGVGRPSTEDNTQRVCLFQSNATWSENSWESRLVRTTDCPEPSRVQNDSTSNINACPDDHYAFSVTWNKSVLVEIEEGSSEERSLGTLRSTIPAVVLRGWLLTSEVHAIFTRRGASGMFLTQELVSPPLFSEWLGSAEEMSS